MLVTDGEPAAIQALEAAIRLEERVMRFLTTRLTELSDAPSPLMRRKSAPAEEAASTDEAATEAETEEKSEAKTEAEAEKSVEAKVEEKTKAAASSEEASA